jgi:hypothetical protein
MPITKAIGMPIGLGFLAALKMEEGLVFLGN